jgi:hypothetical protein
VNFLKSYPLSLFLLPKTIDSVVETEKDHDNLKKAKKKKKKKEEKIDKRKSAGKTKKQTEKTKESAGKSIMTRLYPNKSQRKDLNKWFGTASWTYNQVVASICALPRDHGKYAVVKELRTDFVNKKNSNNEENFADKPCVTKPPGDAALNDVMNAYTSNLAKEDNKNFVIEFKKKK